MKKLVVALMLMFFLARSYAQTTEPIALTKDDYRKKGRSQNTAAWICLGGGVGMMIGGGMINFSQGWGSDNRNKGLWLTYLGGAATLTSIPLFISARKNKKKAASLALTNQNLYLPMQGGLTMSSQPAIAFKVKF